MPRLTADQWADVRAEWEGEPTATFNALADKHGINVSNISRKADKEGWAKRNQLGAFEKLRMELSSIQDDIKQAEIDRDAWIDRAKRTLVSYEKDMAIMTAHVNYKAQLGSCKIRENIVFFDAWCLQFSNKTTREKACSFFSIRRIARNRIRSKATNLIMDILKKGKQKHQQFIDTFGYSPNLLKKNLLRKMPKGYTWDDFLSADLHLDHIVPVAVFNYENMSQPDFFRAWHYTNLQLLPARENLKKSKKLFKLFQPSFAF